MVSSVAAYCVGPSYGARPTMHCQWGCLSSFFVFFVPGDLNLWPLTLTFELGRDFCTVYLTAKFDCLTFSQSEVIVRTNKHTDKHTNKQTDAAENIHLASLRYAGGLIYLEKVELTVREKCTKHCLLLLLWDIFRQFSILAPCTLDAYTAWHRKLSIHYRIV